VVASWEPHPHVKPLATYVLLVSPSGTQYPLYQLPGRDPDVVGWSGDGRQILVETANPDPEILHPGRYYVIDLESGVVEDSFVPGGASDGTASFTTPHGRALLAANLDNADAQWLERYSLGGTPQLRYPNTFPGVNAWTGTWLESPDGTQIVMGAQHGIALVNNNGTLAATLPIRRASLCQPEEFWGSDIILASCFPTSKQQLGPSLYEFSEGWPKPRELTTPPDSDSGYGDAWRVDGKVFVQVYPSCGPPELGELHGHRVSLLVHPYESGIVVGTTPTTLAIESIEGECLGASIEVAWYLPSTNTSVQVLGPPVLSGWTTTAVGYPAPDDVGGPYGS
jgi:hypothetical protein